MTNTVLILGASGRFGRNAAKAFRRSGWQVRDFDRERDTLRQAVHGVQVIVNAWNPAYSDWEKQVPKLHADVIEAAQSVDATVIVPGNVYVYGPDNGAVWGVTTPHKAQNPLGRIRIDMERAYRESGVKTIVLRAGDFIDTEASGNWFDMIMTKNLSRGVFRYPGRPDIPHAWAFLPDLVSAAVELAEKRDVLNRFEDVAFPGYTLTGHEMADSLRRATGRPVRLKQVNWLLFRLLAPVWKMADCLCEMRYLWDTPHRLDGARFDELLPGFEHTSLDDAMRAALPEEEARSGKGYGAMSTQTSL